MGYLLILMFIIILFLIGFCLYNFSYIKTLDSKNKIVFTQINSLYNSIKLHTKELVKYKDNISDIFKILNNNIFLDSNKLSNNIKNLQKLSQEWEKISEINQRKIFFIEKQLENLNKDDTRTY